MASGVAMAASKSVKPSWTFLIRSSKPTNSAPASLAAAAGSPWAKTATRTFLPVPWGRETLPRTIWSLLRGSTPRWKETVTVGSNFGAGKFFTVATASSRL